MRRPVLRWAAAVVVLTAFVLVAALSLRWAADEDARHIQMKVD